MPPKQPTLGRTLDQSVIHLLHRAWQCAGEVFTSEVAVSGLTQRQFAVLVAVAGDEGLSQSELVRRTGIDRSTIADIVHRLVKKGLVRRRRHTSDARAYAVSLTTKGRNDLQAAAPGASRADARILAPLPAAKREELVALLNALVRNAAV